MLLRTGEARNAFKLHVEGAAERDRRPLRKFSSAGSIVEIERNNKKKKVIQRRPVEIVWLKATPQE